MSRRLLALTSALVLLAGVTHGSSRAQEPDDPEQTPTFRTSIDVVTVDVVVTDKEGRPVTDLTKEDFEVRESGRPQTIDSFRLVRIDDGLDDPMARRDILSFEEHRREVAREDNRLFVVFLDDYHVRMSNGMRIREELAEFVSGLSPHDLVAIMTPLLPPSALTFSRNHSATANEIMNFVGRKYDYRPRNAIEERYASDPPAVQERLRNEWVISGLRSLCQYLGTLREGRKTILYVSEGLTSTLPAGVRVDTIYGRTPLGQPNPTSQASNQQLTREFFDSASLLSDMQVVFSAASRTNTSIYTLDPRGLATSEYGVDEFVTQGADTRILTESSDNLRILADQTSGRAIVGKNDPSFDLRQMLQDGSVYYLLTYTSSLAPRDGKFQQIQVRVKRDDVEIRARKGYWAPTAEDVARATAPPRPVASAEVLNALDDLATSLESRRRRGLTLWSGMTRAEDGKALVTVVWESSADAGTLPSERVTQVSITATTPGGETVFSGDGSNAPDLARPSGHVAFEAPPGPVRVSIQAANAAGRRVESSELALDVPDFTAVAPAITTPFVFRGRTARDLQAIRAADSPAPTVLREFSRFERLLVRFRAYGPGGTVPQVTLKLLNQAGNVITTLPNPVRAGDLFESEIGLNAIPPGSYLLEISAGSGHEAARTMLAFRVTG